MADADSGLPQSMQKREPPSLRRPQWAQTVTGRMASGDQFWGSGERRSKCAKLTVLRKLVNVRAMKWVLGVGCWVLGATSGLGPQTPARTTLPPIPHVSGPLELRV